MNGSEVTGDRHTIKLYRIYNSQVDAEVGFRTSQGLQVSLGPGAAMDLYSFEIDDSKTFNEIDTPGSITKLLVQEFMIGGASLTELKEKLAGLREEIGSPAAPQIRRTVHRKPRAEEAQKESKRGKSDPASKRRD